MMLGFGDTTTTTAPATTAVSTTTPPSSIDLYMAGLQLWGTPGTAFSTLGTTISSASSAFTGQALPVSLGLWTPPLLLAAVLIGMSGKRGRR